MRNLLRKNFLLWKSLRRLQMRYLLFLAGRKLGSVEFPDAELKELFEEAHYAARKRLLIREDPLVGKIEEKRATWLKRTERLNDGTLGGEGYTAELTLREAVEASKLPEAATLLYRLIEWRRPATVVEFGTNIGISTTWQAAALRKIGSGHLHTMELSPYRIRFAEKALDELEVRNVTFHNIDFQVAIESEMSSWGPVDFAFVDGDHMRDTTVRYFEKLVEVSSPAAVLVFDDIDWSDGMREAWATIRGSGAIRFSCEFLGMGVIVLS
jgi:predicted O-methyltransferase YrrM